MVGDLPLFLNYRGISIGRYIMLASLILGYHTLTFTPREFEGFRVPTHVEAGPPDELHGRKTWTGTLSAPEDAGYRSAIGVWTNPHFRVRVCDLAFIKGAKNPDMALKTKLSTWNREDIYQIMQKITVAKLGSNQLVVLMGSGLQHTRQQHTLPVFFLECWFATNTKLYEYRFLSTKHEDIELAVKALKCISFISGGTERVAEGLPEGVAGRYSASAPVVVNTEIIPISFPTWANIDGRQWVGTIGNPATDGYFLTLLPIWPIAPYTTDPKQASPRTPMIKKPNVVNDEHIAKLMLEIPFNIKRPLINGHFKALHIPNYEQLITTKAALYVASAPEGEVVFSGHYLRYSRWCGLLSRRGDSKLGDSRFRIELAEIGSLLAPLDISNW